MAVCQFVYITIEANPKLHHHGSDQHQKESKDVIKLKCKSLKITSRICVKLKQKKTRLIDLLILKALLRFPLKIFDENKSRDRGVSSTAFHGRI
jgi:hypothetical protein